MTTTTSERLRTPVSTSELERRWVAVRHAMSGEGVDVLVAYNNTQGIGGYVKYLSDQYAGSGYPLSVVLPVDDAMTLVRHGDHRLDRSVDPDQDPVLRGVKRVLTSWSFASAQYCNQYDAALVVKALAGYASSTVGLVGLSQMPHPMVQHLQESLPKATFVDASDLVDDVKVIKSPEEQEAIRRTARLQEQVLQAAIEAIRPGVRESDILAAAHRRRMELGSSGGVLGIGAAPEGEPATLNPPDRQNRKIEVGDRMILLIECTGPEGYYTELGRTVIVGNAEQWMRDEYRRAAEAQRYCADMLRPGNSSRDIFASYNNLLIERDRPTEKRIHCHGQGYDLVERPLVREDEPMEIQKDMNLACHPSYEHNHMTFWVCDNYLTTSDAPECLTSVSRELIEV